jgi:hypothetical protein
MKEVNLCKLLGEKPFFPIPLFQCSLMIASTPVFPNFFLSEENLGKLEMSVEPNRAAHNFSEY